jgi:hypothetical protein
VTNIDQYAKLQHKYNYQAMLVFSKEATFTQEVLNDQAVHSKSLDWVHCLTHGVDGLFRAKEFAATTHIKITRASG